MKVIVDGMGGDNAPVSIVKGSIDAIKEYGVDILLVGNEEILQKEIDKYNFDKSKIEILHASEVITNEEDPALGIRRKKDSTVVVGLNALKENKGDFFVSAGSTGALLAGGLFITKRIKGINRAALTTVYPTNNGVSLLVDAGANIDSKAEYLDQFALMGSIYIEEVLGVNNPKVGLANIGAEAEKGNELTKSAYKLLENNDHINFIGNVEGRDIPLGMADVIVADGFVGNIILKVTEGVAISLMGQIKDALMTNTKSKLGALLIKPSLKTLQGKLDYREYGGAPLLGTLQPIIKAHGSSDEFAIKNAIRQGITFTNKEVISIIEENLKQINKEDKL